MTVRTRFAPSPTGYMHIGGMRTALFNWLWARRNGGQFILRIDDTDQQRNMDEALGPILEAFRWLGLDWDEGPEVGGEYGPYFQSQRRPLHDAALKQLLDCGAAYRDFEPAEETRAQREAAEKAKAVYVSSRVSLNLSPQDVEAKLTTGEPHVVRFLVPRNRKVAIKDHVRGHVEWDCSLMVDPVIAREDGSPLYNFATVVDDGQLKITHVIRAEEHLSNTPVQVLLHEALGNTLPEFAHIPFVAAPGGKKKLSKRDIAAYRKSPAFQKLFQLGDEVLAALGIDPLDESLSPVMVAYYREVGFLPAGVLNALSRLGWSLDDETENMSLQTVQDHFTLDRVVKSSAGLDPDKLMSYQTYWMSQLPADERLQGCLRFLKKAGLIDDSAGEEVVARVRQVMELAGDRLRVFGDILGFSEFFVSADQLSYDEKEFQKRLVKSDEAIDLLGNLRNLLAASDSFAAGPLHDTVDQFVTEQQLKFGQIAPLLRLSVSGRTKGADLFPMLELIGREECLQRIDRARGRAESLRV
ncbi:MAG: glutamate--tRNA ligase [Planctomycetaceae bacterium]|nr:glutamate--tRNA ligase [Planctomycetaceae bacterium]